MTFEILGPFVSIFGVALAVASSLNLFRFRNRSQSKTENLAAVVIQKLQDNGSRLDELDREISALVPLRSQGQEVSLAPFTSRFQSILEQQYEMTRLLRQIRAQLTDKNEQVEMDNLLNVLDDTEKRVARIIEKTKDPT